MPERKVDSLKKKSKSTRCLKKAEKLAVVTAINVVNKSELVAAVLVNKITLLLMTLKSS